MQERSFLYELRAYLIYVKVEENNNDKNKTICGQCIAIPTLCLHLRFLLVLDWAVIPSFLQICLFCAVYACFPSLTITKILPGCVLCFAFAGLINGHRRRRNHRPLILAPGTLCTGFLVDWMEEINWTHADGSRTQHPMRERRTLSPLGQASRAKQ